MDFAISDGNNRTKLLGVERRFGENRTVDVGRSQIASCLLFGLPLPSSEPFARARTSAEQSPGLGQAQESCESWQEWRRRRGMGRNRKVTCAPRRLPRSGLAIESAALGHWVRGLTPPPPPPPAPFSLSGIAGKILQKKKRSPGLISRQKSNISNLRLL